jgi:hypothetical protein
MKHTIILIAFVAVAISAAAQVRVHRIGAPQPMQRDSTVYILFNYEESPSSLLDRAGAYQQAAVAVPIAGGSLGAALIYLGASDMAKEPDNTSAKAMYYAGFATAGLAAVIGLVYQLKAAGATRKAGRSLSAIRFNANGISYHF